MTATRACLPLMATGLGLLAVHVYFLRDAIDPVGTVLLSILGTCGALAILAGLAMFARTWPDGRAIARARRGEPPADGRLEAFSGEVALEASARRDFESPLLGRPCVAYEYDVEPSEGGGSSYFGVGMSPSAVCDARANVRVLGFPQLDAMPARRVTDADARERAEEYLSSAGSERLADSVAGVADLVGGLLDAALETDGALRRDWRRVEIGPLAEGDTVVERILPLDETVTVLGTWSASRSGVHAGRKREGRLGVANEISLSGGNLVRLAPGGLRAAHTHFVRGKRRAATIGLAWGGLLQGFVWLVWWLSRGETGA